MNQKERKFNITAKHKAAIMDWKIYRNDIKKLEWIVKKIITNKMTCF